MTGDARRATWLALTWTAMLVALAALWVRSPFMGERAAFGIWTGPAALLLWWSARWFRARRVQEIPDGPWLRSAVGIAWLLALWLSYSDVGRLLALDGLILRDAGLRRLGQALRWAPLAFGCGVSLAGLAASLEARYRLVRRSGSASP